MKRIILIATLLIFISSLACAQTNETIVYLFWSKTCPHCALEKPVLEQLEKQYPNLKVVYYEVSENKSNAELYSGLAAACGQNPLGVPATFINGEMILGYDDAIGVDITGKIVNCLSKGNCIDSMTKLQTDNQTCEPPKKTIVLPMLGEVDPTKMSLPVFTVVIAGLDSINPCAFFVLFFLLSLLINAQSRRRMMLIGGVFVFFSAFIYFIFMAAWLNFFLIVGELKAITLIAGVIAVVVSVINIKDFFHFKKGILLTSDKTSLACSHFC
jgi:thiol-disulfide isomerase/thioredoxin